MRRQQMIDYYALKSRRMAPVIQHYTKRDSIIYNLGIGAGVIRHADDALLNEVWEDRLTVLPTMASALCVDVSWHADPCTGISADRTVHGEEALTILHPLPAEGRVRGETRVEEVYDKGAGRGALLVLAKDLSDADSGVAYATVHSTIFLRSDGGFGGPTDSPVPPPIPGRPADRVICQPTRPEQALIYRLSGDVFGIHVDPDFARRVGFDGPILHGLATKGMACRQLVKHFADGDQRRVRHISARFSAPMYPGIPLAIEIWEEGPGRAAYRCSTEGKVVLNDGLFEFE